MSINNRVLIIGDAMIDTYVYGSVNRVSPEAPVPVILPKKEVNCLGGAANVARNAAALGASVSVMFVTGKDSIADTLKTQMQEYGINCSGMIQDETQDTINKVRIVGNKQQIVRIDYHDRYLISEDLQNCFLEMFREKVRMQDIVVLSDYAKGTCTEYLCREIIRICRAEKIPVIVDPKGTDWEKYRGATIITPNMKEINTWSGIPVENDDDKIEKQYGKAYEDLGVQYLLLTRSECGMSLLGQGIVSHIPAETQEVFDVSGAGDTVVAALAATLNPDLNNIKEAVIISNIAAGIVVSKPGTAVVTKEEIRAKLPREVRNTERKTIFKIEDYDELIKQVQLWKTAGEKIVTTNGCFDIIHRGHIKLLDEARKLGDRLIVAINSDKSVKRLKGNDRPVNTELDRAYVIAALKSVDAVVIFDPAETPYVLSEAEQSKLTSHALGASGEAPMKIMSLIRSDVHVKGGDYQAGEIPEAIFAKEVAFVSFVDGYSTTNTIRRMANV